MESVRFVLIVYRDGDPGLMSFSPFGTLRRLIGNSFFNQVGPETSHQRNVFIREFNNTRSNSEKFDTIGEMAKAHINALTAEGSTAEINDITHSTENFAVALWGEILYGNPNYHVGGHVLSLAGIILKLAGDPWPPIWYFFQLLLKRVTPGQPTRSEAKLRTKVSEIIKKNIGKLEGYERDNPDAPLKTIRKLCAYFKVHDLSLIKSLSSVTCLRACHSLDMFQGSLYPLI